MEAFGHPGIPPTWASSAKDLVSTALGRSRLWVTIEAGLALLACGLVEDARRMLAYLAATQQPGGHWAQNFSPDGEPYWTGVQLDEAALPVPLAAKLEEIGALGPLGETAATMVRRALRFVARSGPGSPQDRWEENAGANPFTLATAIAALVAGAELGFLEEPDR